MITHMGASVVVVDDDAAFLALAERVLREMGAESVTTASDAASGVTTVEATRPDAVLVDVGLPDRDGVDLALELAALPWRPRVVLTSTDDAVGAIGSDAERSAVPFLPKQELPSSTMRRLLLGE
jgi:CheY-like chemotaxis protein